MAHRKWKEIKQQPGTAGPGSMLGCCLVPFHFLWAILCPQAVEHTKLSSGCASEALDRLLRASSGKVPLVSFKLHVTLCPDLNAQITVKNMTGLWGLSTIFLNILPAILLTFDAFGIIKLTNS